MTRHKRAVLAIALLILLTPLLVAQSSGRATFGWVIANRATVQDGGLTVIGDSALGGTTTAGNIVAEDVALNNLEVDGSLSATLLNFTASEVVSLTNHLTWEPQEAYTPISSAGAVSVQLSACDAGRLIVIVNTVNQTITFSDTAPAILSGSTALGQYDTLTLMGDGTRCIEVAQVDN